MSKSGGSTSAVMTFEKTDSGYEFINAEYPSGRLRGPKTFAGIHRHSHRRSLPASPEEPGNRLPWQQESENSGCKKIPCSRMCCGNHIHTLAWRILKAKSESSEQWLRFSFVVVQSCTFLASSRKVPKEGDLRGHSEKACPLKKPLRRLASQRPKMFRFLNAYSSKCCNIASCRCPKIGTFSGIGWRCGAGVS